MVKTNLIEFTYIIPKLHLNLETHIAVHAHTHTPCAYVYQVLDTSELKRGITSSVDI